MIVEMHIISINCEQSILPEEWAINLKPRGKPLN